jgi:hypothetical protein
MKKMIFWTVLFVMILVPALGSEVLGQVNSSQKQDRFRINSAEPDGFLGLRLGNSFRFAEETLGEPDIVRNGSLEWRLRDADYDPYSAITVLGEKRKISGFVAYLRPNRIQFRDMNLVPKPNSLGRFFASRRYLTGGYDVLITVEGDDVNYVSKIILQAKEKE